MDCVKSGELLRELRKQKKLSQKEVAERIHVSSSALSRWEGGSRKPAENELRLLAEFYGVSIDFLTGAGNTMEDTAEDAPENPEAYQKNLETCPENEYRPETALEPDNCEKPDRKGYPTQKILHWIAAMSLVLFGACISFGILVGLSNIQEPEYDVVDTYYEEDGTYGRSYHVCVRSNPSQMDNIERRKYVDSLIENVQSTLLHSHADVVYIHFVDSKKSFNESTDRSHETLFAILR